MGKECSKCKENKDLVKFGSNKRAKDGRQSSCLDCNRERLNANAKRWYQANTQKGLAIAHKWKALNPDKHTDLLLKKRYNITLDQKKKMHEEQSGKCPICLKHEKDLKRKLVVDHCHETKKVRELLCDSCNRALGFIGENIETAKRLVEYIVKHRKARG